MSRLKQTPPDATIYSNVGSYAYEYFKKWNAYAIAPIPASAYPIDEGTEDTPSTSDPVTTTPQPSTVTPTPSTSNSATSVTVPTVGKIKGLSIKAKKKRIISL